MPYLLLFQKASPNCGSYYKGRTVNGSQAVAAPSLRLQLPPQTELQVSSPRALHGVTSAFLCPQTRLDELPRQRHRRTDRQTCALRTLPCHTLMATG